MSTIIALLKGIKGFNPGKIKDTTTAQQELNNINSQIEELQSKLDRAEAAQNTVLTEANVNDKVTASVIEKTYTKAEIDNLLSDVVKKLPQLDDKGNMTWTDPNGNLVVVHVGDVVIGGDDVIVVDGNLSTTSTHPVQNKVVTNALNEKQDKSTTLSFGATNGRWTPLTNSNYLESYTNIDGAGFDIKQNMIVRNLDNIANENQLITATAVKNALDAMTTNPGGGTQPEYDYNLIDLFAGTLVTQYTYQTNAPYAKIVEFAENMCEGTISEKWCDLRNYPSQHKFVITKRTVGYDLKQYEFYTLPNNNYYLVTLYSVNIPDDINPVTYANETFCTNRDYCYIADILNNFAAVGPMLANQEHSPIFSISTVSGIIPLNSLPEEYEEANQQTLDD